MNENTQRKPTLEYLQALTSESRMMIEEYIMVVTRKKKMSREDRDKWNERREFISNEIKRVRKLL